MKKVLLLAVMTLLVLASADAANTRITVQLQIASANVNRAGGPTLLDFAQTTENSLETNLVTVPGITAAEVPRLSVTEYANGAVRTSDIDNTATFQVDLTYTGELDRVRIDTALKNVQYYALVTNWGTIPAPAVPPTGRPEQAEIDTEWEYWLNNIQGTQSVRTYVTGQHSANNIFYDASAGTWVGVSYGARIEQLRRLTGQP